jgi:hypothetical protein
MTLHRYTPRPLRECIAEKTAADLQRDIDLMRAMYAERRTLNTPRNTEMIGWSLVAIGVGLPVLVAIAVLI